MDEPRLREVFDEAAGAPPPGFDHARVVAASRRVTARRRATVLATAAALVVVAGIGVAAAVLPDRGDRTSAASAPAEVVPEGGVPQAGVPGADDREADADPPVAGAPEPAVPEDSDAAAAEAGPGPAGPPLGPGDPEACANRQDPAVRALVEQVFPEVAGATEAAVTMECRPGGERGLALEVVDDGRRGLLSVTYLPPGESTAFAPYGPSAPTASGGTVVVSSTSTEPGGGAPPFADRLEALTAFLAERL